MESPDVVDTSDVEEREVLSLSDDVDHWTGSTFTPLKSIRADVLVPPQGNIKQKGHQSQPNSILTPMARHDWFSDHEENPSPRKRIKIIHNEHPVSLGPVHPTTIEVSVPGNTLPDAARVEQGSSSPLKHSREHMVVVEDEQDSLLSLPVPEDSQPLGCPSLFSPRPRERDSPNATNQLRSQSPGSHSTPRQPSHSSPRSLSVPSDHNSLFSSPSHHPTTPPQTNPHHTHGQNCSARRKLHPMGSSPLTPTSSPIRSLPQSPDPIQLLAPQLPEVPHSPGTYQPALAPPVDPQPLGRYSLRRREARQLNPYAYDNLLYKQQLKSHPDAIVKFRSHRPRSGTGNEDFLNIPDEDGDYVDIDIEGGERKKSRAQSLDQRDEAGDDEVGQIKKGWLPESLRELSSSDEDDDEICRLAKRIRKQRERAEAKARAEARKVAIKAHQAEVMVKKLTRKRPKSFPVPDVAEDERVRTPEPMPPTSPSPSLFLRARSEPAVLPISFSPTTSPSRPSAPTRASSYSPAFSSRPIRSPDFTVNLQQEDPYQFSGHDDAPSPHHLPVDLSSTYSSPPSPSVPTSSACGLPPITSGMESESDESSVFEMNAGDRKKLRALRRMMPAAMITRQLGVAKAIRRPAPRTGETAESSGSEAEEVRLMPGIARARKRRYTDVEVRGDPESSDVEQPAEVYDNDGKADAMEILSDSQSAVRIRRTRCASPRPGNRDDVISLSDSSLLGSSPGDSRSNSSDEEKAHRSLFDRPARGPARESLIDWMLCRTSSDRPKPKVRQSTRRRKPPGATAPRLDIITSGARRYGAQHQTRLPFVRGNMNSKTTSSNKRDPAHRVQSPQLDQNSDEERRTRKNSRGRQSRTNHGPLYNIHHDATCITSKHHEGRPTRASSTMVLEDDGGFRQVMDPGWRAEVERWNKSRSPARQLTANLPTSASTATPLSRLRRRTSPRPQHEIPLTHYFHHEGESYPFMHHHTVIDMNITPLPSGVKFGTLSYIGKGLLYQLSIATIGNLEITRPVSCNVQGLEIEPTTSAAVFSALLGPLCDRHVIALREYQDDASDMTNEWGSVAQASSRLLSWLSVHAEDREFAVLEVALREYSDRLLLVLDSLETNIFTLTTYWFVVELAARFATGVKYRRGSAANDFLFYSAKQLMRCLLHVDLQPALATFRAAESDVDNTSLPLRAAELWICLIHLLPSFEISSEAPSHPLWRLLAGLYSESPDTAGASEDMWRTIFSLCAISQFSVHGLSTSTFRLPAAWELVAAALRKTILTANPEEERRLPQRAFRKRDEYVSYVVSRCFLLWKHWEWRLDDGIVMFKSLQEIFRSRNFANLLNERSAPMGFLENGDLELLSKRDPHDSGFEVFLKMVVQAVRLLNTNILLDPKQRSVSIKKLLQMAVPVSPVPFSRSAPPSPHSLSMLVNRFSAMAVAIHLDPTYSNVKFRTGQARRCVDFKHADDHSRVACVYGMMNFAMIVRHHEITGGLEEVLGWLGEMANVLMDEYKEGEIGAVEKKMITTLIQLLIGSVRRVIETQSLDKRQKRAEYPDPALLDGPWVTRVFNPRADLLTIQQTGVEIRMLVQSFLDARLKALPEVQPPVPIVHDIESQESQNEYDKHFLDLNDEELLAALGGETEASAVADIKLKEDTLCKVLDKFITPAVYRLVCRCLGESENVGNGESTKAADEWIDCWVGCANVLVQNNYKDWGLYMKLGKQSWEKIINDAWRRRVGLRFNFALLRLDPGAYHKMKEDFIAVLLGAVLSYKPTIEHEFVSMVLSLDGLQHPLLRDAPFGPIPGTRKYEVSQADYAAAREQLIKTVFANVASFLRARVDAESQAYVELIVVMLATMRDIYQELNEEKAEYGEFCRRVFGVLSDHLELRLHPRLSDALAWGKRELNV